MLGTMSVQGNFITNGSALFSGCARVFVSTDFIERIQRIMAVKEWFRRLQPVQLYIVLTLTVAFFIVEIVASHVTHALTLLLNAYHMVCNIIALGGCIASIKYGRVEKDPNDSNASSTRNSNVSINANDKGSAVSVAVKTKQLRSDRRMKNTFGWARIDIVTMLVCCVLLTSFCFSILVEALQTLVHIDHLDEMHHPLPVMCIGASGILLNALCYILIGGYTFNQGSYLHVTKNGDVILRRNLHTDEARDGQAQLSTQTRRSPLSFPKSQGFREMCRDAMGCILVMVVSILVYFTDRNVAKYLDPIFAIISSILLFVFSYPYMKESGLILLQTIPNHINIDSLKKELLEAFPGIVNVHDLHVWQLAGEKVISTAHIIFLDPTVYASITDQITMFFVEMGITHVTIQPEFYKMKPNLRKTDCLIRCQNDHCSSSQCCSREKFIENLIIGKCGREAQSVNRRFEKKETIPSPPATELTKSTVYNCDEVHGESKDASDSTNRPRNEQSSEITTYTINVDIIESTQGSNDDTVAKGDSGNGDDDDDDDDKVDR